MKNILLASTLLLPSILLSYELDFNKTFTKSIQNDKLQTNISIKIDSKNIDYINEKIEDFQNFINKNTSITKKNGSYNLIPNYVYQNKERKFVGYKGTLNYIIESPDHKKINYFIKKLNNIKEKMSTSNVKLTISNLKWIVSKKLYDNNMDDMRIESIYWIKNYMKKIDENCMINHISINQNNNYIRQSYSKSAMVESTKTYNVVPSQSARSITLKTNYKLECK